jgi:hypothetical protein
MERNKKKLLMQETIYYERKTNILRAIQGPRGSNLARNIIIARI